MRLRLGGVDSSQALEDGEYFARIPGAGPVRLGTTKGYQLGAMSVRRSLYILNDNRTLHDLVGTVDPSFGIVYNSTRAGLALQEIYPPSWTEGGFETMPIHEHQSLYTGQCKHQLPLFRFIFGGKFCLAAVNYSEGMYEQAELGPSKVIPGSVAINWEARPSSLQGVVWLAEHVLRGASIAEMMICQPHLRTWEGWMATMSESNRHDELEVICHPPTFGRKIHQIELKRKDERPGENGGRGVEVV